MNENLELEIKRLIDLSKQSLSMLYSRLDLIDCKHANDIATVLAILIGDEEKIIEWLDKQH